MTGEDLVLQSPPIREHTKQMCEAISKSGNHCYSKATYKRVQESYPFGKPKKALRAVSQTCTTHRGKAVKGVVRWLKLSD